MLITDVIESNNLQHVQLVPSAVTLIRHRIQRDALQFAITLVLVYIFFMSSDYQNYDVLNIFQTIRLYRYVLYIYSTYRI